jgi:hypothetical protein
LSDIISFPNKTHESSKEARFFLSTKLIALKNATKIHTHQTKKRYFYPEVEIYGLNVEVCSEGQIFGGPLD